MTTRFGDAALVLCSLSARTLGWRPHEFWSATPDELATALGIGAATGTAALDRASLTRIFGETFTEPPA